MCLTFTYAQFTDDFADGDYTSVPAWSGSGALFVVADDAGNQRLRSNSSDESNYHLSTPNAIVDDVRWEFFIDLRFPTSANNYVDVYLMSNAADLASGVDGYFVRIGGASDGLELFRSDGNATVTTGLTAGGVVESSSSNPFLIRVERTSDAEWTLHFDDGATGTWIEAGTVTDATYTSTSYFGVYIKQGPGGTPQNNHFFDDFSVGPIPVDLTPPALVSAAIITDAQIDLVFSEAVDQNTAEEENNYNIIPLNSAAAVVRDALDFTLVHLTLAIAMQNGNTYTITVNGVEDAAGNACVNETEDVTFVVPDDAVPGDVIINEIMADPSPTVGLPDVEFVELFNATTDKTFDLTGWFYSDGGDELTLPPATLPPGGYMIVASAANVTALSAFGATVAPSGSVSLTNTGDPVTIKEPGGTTIDAVSYELGWYNDDVKAVGGWTLERIDPTMPCGGASNWTASNDPQGGTPGAQNSTYESIPNNDDVDNDGEPNCSDPCPFLASMEPGDDCDDGNSNTADDAVNADCECVGIPIDCEGVPNGSAQPGTPCDDTLACTLDDLWDTSCACIGTWASVAIDTIGNSGPVCAGTPLQLQAWTLGSGVIYAWTGPNGFTSDAEGPIISGPTVADSGLYTLTVTNGCDTAVASTMADVDPLPSDAVTIVTQNICAGGTTASLGGNAPTVGTGVWSVVSGGTGTFSSATSPNATFSHTGEPGPIVVRWTITSGACPPSSADLEISVVQPPTPAAAGGPHLICEGATTPGLGGNMAVSGVGQWVVVNGGMGTFLPWEFDPNAGFQHWEGTGPVLLRWTITGDPLCPASFAPVVISIADAYIGNPCDDGDPVTVDDAFNSACQCVGQLAIDCAGETGGSAQPGTNCNDGILQSTNDVWSANCECLGTYATDCEDEVGGQAQPGSACYDVNGCPGTWNAGCQCSGQIALGPISGNGIMLYGSTYEYVYTVPIIPGAVYHWQLPPGWNAPVTNEWSLTLNAGSYGEFVELGVYATLGDCTWDTVWMEIVTIDVGMVDGVENEDVTLFTVRPNPSDGRFELMRHGPAIGYGQFIVEDPTGRAIGVTGTFSSESTFIDLGAAASGLYLLRLHHERRTNVLRLVVR